MDVGRSSRHAKVKISNMEDFQKVNIRKLSMLQEIEWTIQSYCQDSYRKACEKKRQIQGEEVEEGEAECNWMEEANELFKVIVKIPTVKRISGFDYCLR